MDNAYVFDIFRTHRKRDIYFFMNAKVLRISIWINLKGFMFLFIFSCALKKCLETEFKISEKQVYICRNLTYNRVDSVNLELVFIKSPINIFNFNSMKKKYRKMIEKNVCFSNQRKNFI